MARSARVASTFGWCAIRRARIATTCAGVLPGQKTASGAPARSARWWSTFANPRSSNGSPRSLATAASTSTRPAFKSSRSARRASLSTVRFRLQIQEEIGAARLKAGEVDRDIEVPELAQALDDGLAPIALPEPRHLGLVDLEPGQPIVVAHAELAEAERAHERLGGVHLTQLLGRDPIAVLEARGQARERGLVPRGQAELVRERADLVLPQLGLDQGCTDAPLARGLHARAMIAAVVHVGAIDERPAALARRDRLELEEQLLLAEEAAVGRVARVVRVLELLGAHDQVAHAQELAEPAGLVELASWIGLRVGRDEQSPLAQRVLRGAREQGGIDAARERDDDAVQRAQDVHQTVVLGLRHRLIVARVSPRRYGSTRIRSWNAV